MTLWKNLFIGAYLIIQLILPLRGFWYDRFENRGNFSWNMYSYFYGCSIRYRVDTPQGETLWPNQKEYFNREGNSGATYFSHFIPEFHRWMCDKFRNEGKLGTMRGYVNCRSNGGPYRALVDHTVDLCTAPNYGVIVQQEAQNK